RDRRRRRRRCRDRSDARTAFGAARGHRGGRSHEGPVRRASARSRGTLERGRRGAAAHLRTLRREPPAVDLPATGHRTEGREPSRERRPHLPRADGAHVASLIRWPHARVAAVVIAANVLAFSVLVAEQATEWSTRWEPA